MKFKTIYLAVSGEGTVFPGEEALGIRDITDGTSNTLMVVEADADQAVVWTKPGDWKFDPKEPLKGLGKLRQRGFYALRADGSVGFFSNSLDPDTLRAMFTRAGGEAIP